MCVCVYTCRHIYEYVVGMCTYAYVFVYICLCVYVSINLLPCGQKFSSPVRWISSLGGLKRAHILVQFLSTVRKIKLAFPHPREGVHQLLFGTQGTFCVEGRDESRKRPGHRRYTENKCSSSGENSWGEGKSCIGWRMGVIDCSAGLESLWCS